MFKHKHIILFFIIILAQPIFAAHPEEYINEFSNPNENCNHTFAFNFYNNNQFNQIIYYTCCTITSCTYLPFDITAQSFHDASIQKEYFKTTQAINHIATDSIKQSTYKYELGFDVCNFLNFKDEATNVAADTTYDLSPILTNHKTAKDIRKVISVARISGIIAKGNLYSLAGSIVCGISLRSEEQALNKINNCSYYYFALSNKISYSGIIEQFYICNTQAIAEVSNSNDKLLVKIHKFVNSLTNINHPEKSVAEIFKRALENMPSDNVKLLSNNYEQQYNQAILRIGEKQNNANYLLATQINLHHSIKSNQPNPFFIFVLNIFISPDKDYSHVRKILISSEQLIDSSEELIKISKYNSATAKLKTSDELLYSAQNAINDENCKSTHPDLFLIATILGILILAIAIAILKKQKNTLSVIVIILIIVLISSIYFSKESQNLCHISKTITQINTTLQEPYIIEEYDNVTHHNISWTPIGPNNIPAQEILSSKPYSTHIKNNICFINHTFKNPNNYSITVNISLGIIFYTELLTETDIILLNRTQLLSFPNITLKPNQIYKINHEIDSRTNEITCKVDSLSTYAKILSGNTITYSNRTNYYNLTELSNITHYLLKNITYYNISLQ